MNNGGDDNAVLFQFPVLLETVKFRVNVLVLFVMYKKTTNSNLNKMKAEIWKAGKTIQSFCTWVF